MTDIQLEYLRGFRDGARREVHDELKPMIEQILTGIAETYNGVVNNLIDNITIEAIPAEKWVPCSERLPEKAGEYLVTYHPCYWDDVEWSKRCAGIDTFRGKSTWAKKKYQRVIAWMPMPKPYEPKKESEVPHDD